MPTIPACPVVQASSGAESHADALSFAGGLGGYRYAHPTLSASGRLDGLKLKDRKPLWGNSQSAFGTAILPDR